MVALFGSDLRVYSVEFDADFFADLVAAGGRWWQRHVVEGEMPEVTAESREVLSRIYPRQEKQMEMATEEVRSMARAYDKARADVKAAESNAEYFANELRALIGDREGYSWPDGHVTWKAQAGRVAWKEAAMALGYTEKMAETFRGPANRVLRVHLKE